MIGQAVGMQEADRHRLDARRLEGFDRRLEPGPVEGSDDLAVGADPLDDLQAVLARHQRNRLADAVIVKVGPRLAADLQDVAKALGGQEPGQGAAALDDHVGGHRGAVPQVADGVRRDPVVRQHPRHARLDGLGRIPRGRRNLDVTDHSALLAEESEIGEGSSHVDANSIHDPQGPFRAKARLGTANGSR